GWAHSWQQGSARWWQQGWVRWWQQGWVRWWQRLWARSFPVNENIKFHIRIHSEAIDKNHNHHSHTKITHSMLSLLDTVAVTLLAALRQFLSKHDHHTRV